MRWVAVVILFAANLQAQDFAGSWQGLVKAGARQFRIVFDIDKDDAGGWKGTLYSLDQSTGGTPVTSVTVEGSTLKLAVEAIKGSYEGKISADGMTIEGTWKQGAPVPFELRRATKDTAWQRDPSPHKVQFINVDTGVKLEVLDWGGSGRPLVLLTGLGNDAHIYDKFAPKLTGAYHVYGITRRGFGASSIPDTGYSADRLGDDVLAVMDALKLDRPVLAAHSIGGEELSSIGSRHPEKVAGLIYLDAGYPYAYYAPTARAVDVDLDDLRGKLDKLQSVGGNSKQLIQELLDTTLPGFALDLRESLKDLEATPAAMLAAPVPPQPMASRAMIAGLQKYTKIPVPILAIFAVPHNMGPGIDSAARAAFEARDQVTTEAQAKAFESGLPSAHVVRLPHANHYVFISNEADVLREMNAFIEGLPR